MRKKVSIILTSFLFLLFIVPNSVGASFDSGTMTTNKTVNGTWGIYRSEEQNTYGKGKPNGCFTVGISKAAEPWKYSSGCYIMTGVSNGTEINVYSNRVGTRNHSYFGAQGE